jgi:NADPH-dependent curcumin reductase
MTRPIGLPKSVDFSITEEAIPSPGEGQVLVKILYISLDPAMRGWMSDARSYMPPVALGSVMRAGTVGRVVASKSAALSEGDFVVGHLGVQEFAVANADQLQRVDSKLAPLSTYLGGLGMTGLSAYFGLFEVGLPKAGDTVLVSGAAGAVGAVVGQLAKIHGCTVVGIAGGPDKCAYLRSIGFDAAIDYKSENLAEALKTHGPNGIDVFFDNVGGATLDAGLARLRLHARVVICGAISVYNATAPAPGPANYLSLLVNRARLEGFIVFDYIEKYGTALAELTRLYTEGRLKLREHVVQGSVADFAETLLLLFRGENSGKLVLKIAAD